MAVYLIESKVDQQKLIDHVGENTAKLFFSMKDRLKSPENDIYYWLKREPEELIDRLSDLQNTKTRSQKDEEASKGAELIYNKDGWKVYHITTYPASVKYGKNTKWCISGSKVWDNGEKGEYYFNTYTSKGVEFYFYIKNGNEKYALAYTPQNGNYQVFNAEDDELKDESISFLPNVEGLPRFNCDDLIDENGVFYYKGIDVPYKYRALVKSIVFSEDINEIGELAFSHCDQLAEVIIPDTISIIGNGAFAYCHSLKNVKIPESVKEIQGGVFLECTSLTDVQLPSSITIIEAGLFGWCSSLTNVNIPNGVTEIEHDAFRGCGNLRSIDLPEGLTYLFDGAFMECGLESVILPSTLTVLGSFVFKGCTDLELVVISSSLYGFGTDVFVDCMSLKFVEIKEKIGNKLRSGLFEKCKSLESIIIPDGVKSIGDRAFSQCNSLETVSIPISLETVYISAFDGCNNLRKVYYEGTESDWYGNIKIVSYGNKALLNAEIIFNSRGN